MFYFSNESFKMILYFLYTININSHSFIEPGDIDIIGKKSVRVEPEFVNMNSQINLNQSEEVLYHEDSNKIEFAKCIASDLTMKTRESIIHNTDQQYLLSSLSNTQENCSKYTINKLNELDESSSSDRYEEIDVETIDTDDGNKHNNAVDPELENNQRVNPVPKESKLQKYFHNGIFKPYIFEKVDAPCSKSNYFDSDTTQFNDVNLPSRGNFGEPTLLDRFKTNHRAIHENVVFLRTVNFERTFSSDIRTLDYLSNSSLLSRNINHNVVAYEDSIRLPVEAETILDITGPHINTNKDIGHFKGEYSKRNFDSIFPKQFLKEPPTKISRHISSVVDYDGTLISSFPQIIKTTNKDIIDTRDKLESVNTLSSKHDSKEDLINSISICTNKQQTFNNIDSNPDQLEEVITERYFHVSMRDYKTTENDDISLRKISEDFYNFNFIFKDTLISWSFDRKDNAYLFLKMSSTSIKATDIIFAESVFNFSIKSLQWKCYMYSIPIFHTVDFITPNNTLYFKISASTNKYGINQTLDVYICRSKRGGRQELRLKCPRIHDYKQLFKNLLETKFPIHSFPVSKKPKIIQFSSLDHDLVKKDITINEYINNVTQNPSNIEIKPIKEYKFGYDSRSDRKNSDRSLSSVGNQGLKLFMIFTKLFKSILNKF